MRYALLFGLRFEMVASDWLLCMWLCGCVGAGGCPDCLLPVPISAELTPLMRCHLVQSLITFLLFQTGQISMPYHELLRHINEHSARAAAAAAASAGAPTTTASTGASDASDTEERVRKQRRRSSGVGGSDTEGGVSVTGSGSPEPALFGRDVGSEAMAIGGSGGGGDASDSDGDGGGIELFTPLEPKRVKPRRDRIPTATKPAPPPAPQAQTRPQPTPSVRPAPPQSHTRNSPTATPQPLPVTDVTQRMNSGAAETVTPSLQPAQLTFSPLHPTATATAATAPRTGVVTATAMVVDDASDEPLEPLAVDPHAAIIHSALQQLQQPFRIARRTGPIHHRSTRAVAGTGSGDGDEPLAPLTAVGAAAGGGGGKQSAFQYQMRLHPSKSTRNQHSEMNRNGKRIRGGSTSASVTATTTTGGNARAKRSSEELTQLTKVADSVTTLLDRIHSAFVTGSGSDTDSSSGGGASGVLHECAFVFGASLLTPKLAVSIKFVAAPTATASVTALPGGPPLTAAAAAASPFKPPVVSTQPPQSQSVVAQTPQPPQRSNSTGAGGVGQPLFTPFTPFPPSTIKRAAVAAGITPAGADATPKRTVWGQASFGSAPFQRSRSAITPATAAAVEEAARHALFREQSTASSQLLRKLVPLQCLEQPIGTTALHVLFRVPTHSCDALASHRQLFVPRHK